MANFLHKQLSEIVLKTYFDVYNYLGYGFLEKVYQNAMYFELKEKGYKVEIEKPIKVYFKEQLVGEYYADLVVEDLIILELKAADCIVAAFENQILNYLKGTDCEVGLLLNFGTKPEFRRKIFENSKKVWVEEIPLYFRHAKRLQY